MYADRFIVQPAQARYETEPMDQPAGQIYVAFEAERSL